MKHQISSDWTRQMTGEVKPKRCVIADDVRASREKVRAWLKECQFDCQTATDGQQAWNLVKDNPPDLLVSDIEMPAFCGLELLQRIRKDSSDQLRQLPVLIITSLKDGQTLDVVQQLGGNGLLQKPLNKQATLSVVLDLVAGRQSLRQMNHSNVPGKGPISPTLRRLLKTVAEFESS